MMDDGRQHGTQPTVNGGQPANGHGHGHGPAGHPFSQEHARATLNAQQRQYLWDVYIDQLEQHRQMVTNLSTISRQWLTQQSDPRRNLFDECGYPQEPSVDLYRTLYDREPVATTVVELLPQECWQATPTVFEDMDADTDTQFEQEWDGLGRQLRGENSCYQDEIGSPIWDKLKRVDIVSGIGSFGILLIGVDDGKNLQEPIDGVLATADGPLTTDEEKALKNPQPRWKGDDTIEQGSGKGVPTRDDKLGAQPLSNSEQLIVNQWVQERQRNWTLNASGQYEQRRAPRDRGFHVPGKEVSATRAKPLDPTKRNPAELDLTSFQMSGTDRQYEDHSLGIGMPPPIGSPPPSPFGQDLTGTDAQYLGVQFGPSEMPAGVHSGDGEDDDALDDELADEDGEEQPDEKPKKKRPKLLFLRPYGEDLVQIVRYEWNIRNPRFGMPVMYRVTLNDPRTAHSGVGLPLATVFVHWSRVIHIADNLKSSEVFGVPRLQNVLNPVLDIQKIRGAGAEGYYKSAFTGLQFVTHPQLGGDVFLDESSLKDSAEKFQNSLQRIMTSKGGSWQTIAPTVTDPTPHIAVNVEAICIAMRCPVPVFKGYEIGEQASENNDSAWNKRKHERQNNYLTPKVIVPLVDRLIQIGVLPRPGGAKDKLAKVQQQQPQAKVERVANGWLIRNYHRPVVNAPPPFAKKQPPPVSGQMPPGHPAAKAPGAPTPAAGKTPVPPKQGDDTAALKPGDDTAATKPGQPQPPATKKSTVFLADGGYSVEWPDADSISKSDKATIAGTLTTALAAYVSGGCEAVMPFKQYLVEVWGWEEEKAAEMIEAAKQLHEENQMDDPLSMPRQVGGQEAAPEPGTKAFEDQQLQQEMVKKGIPPGGAPVPGQGPPKPGQPLGQSGKMGAVPPKPGQPGQPPQPGGAVPPSMQQPPPKPKNFGR